MKISVIVPAHNEQDYIGACLESIKLAKKDSQLYIEVIVCLNRCTDRTEEIAKKFGAIIVREDAKNLAKIRNAGVRAASGDVVVTIDADSRMSPNMLTEIEKLLNTSKYIGGGTRIKPERLSLGILVSSLVILFYALRFGLKSAGLFWCFRKDFETIGGFNESLVTLEDLDFANRLASFGKTKNLKYGTAWCSHIITSCRKFDKFGDWYFAKNPSVVRNLFSGKDHAVANQFYYDVKR